MKRLAGFALVLLGVLGCSGHAVAVLAPEGVHADNCVHTCEALFGKKPTLNCGERDSPRRVLECNYEPSPWEVVPAPADAPCRAECARAGFTQLEGCFELKTRGGVPTVACQYATAFR